MLALTDEALARFAIGATRVPQNRRAKWLRRLARQLDPQSPNPNAQACRDARLRAKNGQVYFRIPVDIIGMEQLLEAEGLLQAQVDHSHHEIESALTTFLSALTDITVGQDS